MYNHALTAFETRVQFRRSAFWIGALLLVLPTLIFLIANRGRFATGMLGYAFFASLSLRMTLGLAEDRQTGHELLMANFATPTERLVSRFAALLLREIAFFALVWILAAIASDSVQLGLWYAVLFQLIALLLLPLAVAIEFIADIRIPGALALIIAVAVFIAAAQVSDSVTVFRWMGLPNVTGSWSALGPLLLRAGAALSLTLVLCVARVLATKEARA